MRWVLAEVWRTLDRARRDRALLYGGATGLRIITFHETRGDDLRRLQQIVDWCRRRFAMATPEDADAVFAGSWPHAADRVLVTFDDGWESNYEVARWLADIGLSATFFIVPSLVGRTADEYIRFHGANHVVATVPEASAGTRGLSIAQLREMRAMGHRIGAHNFAHRDLGLLRALPDIRYEIDNALEGVSAILGTECNDFAIAFGQPGNVSDEAISYLRELQARGLRIYSCHRGLNVPGKTPCYLLRHGWEPFHPANFTRICIEGGGDRRLNRDVQLMVSRVGKLPVANGAALQSNPS